ncbi:MAG: hypothetical protein ACRDXB_05820, partial [Actinomycetes bacterium]
MISGIVRRNPVLALSAGVRGWITASTAAKLAVLGCYVGQGFLVANLLSGLVTGRPPVGRAAALGGLVGLIALRAA